MIERDTKNVPRGQMELGDLMADEGTTPPGADAPPSPERGGIQAGYDALGHLINPFLVAEVLEVFKGWDDG